MRVHSRFKIVVKSSTTNLFGINRFPSACLLKLLFGSAKRSLDGYGQSIGHDSGRLGAIRSQFAGAAESSHYQVGAGGQSQVPLTLFTACLVVLVAYTTLKLLSVRLNGNCKSRYSHKATEEEDDDEQDGRRQIERDFGCDRRKFARLNREQRARQLILHHGGRNVAEAMKFLALELERQKRQLIVESNLEGNDEGLLSCLCNCHSEADNTSQQVPTNTQNSDVAGEQDSRQPS